MACPGPPSIPGTIGWTSTFTFSQVWPGTDSYLKPDFMLDGEIPLARVKSTWERARYIYLAGLLLRILLCSGSRFFVDLRHSQAYLCTMSGITKIKIKTNAHFHSAHLRGYDMISRQLARSMAISWFFFTRSKSNTGWSRFLVVFGDNFKIRYQSIRILDIVTRFGFHECMADKHAPCEEL